MKKLLCLLVLLAAALAAGSYYINQQRQPEHTPYKLAAIEFGSLAESVSGTGVFRPREVVLVAAKVPGQVAELEAVADFNQTVREGDPLLKLDDRLAREKLSEAEFAVAEAEAHVAIKEKACHGHAIHLRETRKIQPSGNASEAQVEAAQTEYDAAVQAIEAARLRVKAARAALEQARLNLEWTTVRVPSLGAGSPKRSYTIVDRKVEVGQQVGPQCPPLFTLVHDLGQLELQTQIAESDIGKVGPGQAVEFTVSTYPEREKPFTGTVQQIRYTPVSSQGTAVYYPVIVSVKNERDSATGLWRLRPGMTASVDVVQRLHQHVWKVPTQALSFHPDDAQLSPAARARLDRRGTLPNPDQWKTVWVLDEQRQPSPLFVRVGGTNAAGEPGIRDTEFTEVLEWDPTLARKPDPDSSASIPQVIIEAPKNDKLGGLLKSPLKL